MRPLRPPAPLLLTVVLAVVLTMSLAGCAKGPDGGVVVGLPHYVTQESASMEPTIRAGERVRTWPLPDRIERGGIFVVQFQGDSGKFLKRVVGLPGERVGISGGRVTIDGRPIAEPYLAPGVSTGGVHELQLGPDQYYVLGDNRPDSADSRFKGPVARAQLLAYAKA
jgi:signal peptidase I